MLTIAVGGLAKDEIANLIKETGGEKVEAIIKSDLDAAMMVKNGQAQLYIGACHTGGGGSLAMPLALLGRGKCMTIAIGGKELDADNIACAVKDGIIAFGLVTQMVNQYVPIIVKAAIENLGE
ncbi:MAG: DUF2620 domain-containing protein [Defluviitaleaceae bacterium]|nr:DUF2620 domain-containing protein [Defluviitaleaceae bacterium]